MGVRIERWNGLADNLFPEEPGAVSSGETVGENIGEEIAAQAAGTQAGTEVSEDAELQRLREMLPSIAPEAEPSPISPTAMWIGVGVLTVGALFFVMTRE